jgi:hypothetical protein
LKTVAVLNRLLALHSRSLPSYLASARPYCRRGDERAREVLDHIFADHQLMVDQIATLIAEERGVPNLGTYPMEYTDLHDLAIDYVIGLVIAQQKKDIATIETCVAEIGDHARGRALALEALGAAKGHLESLEELMTSPAPAVS